MTLGGLKGYICKLDYLWNLPLVIYTWRYLWIRHTLDNPFGKVVESGLRVVNAIMYM